MGSADAIAKDVRHASCRRVDLILIAGKCRVAQKQGKIHRKIQEI